MTIAEALKRYYKIEIELLLAHVLQKPKEFIFLHGEVKLTSAQNLKLEKLVKLRLQGCPIAYLLGYKDFYGLRFKVNKNVLIPRPETEWLVERVLLHDNPKKRILDMGTGSGAIIVSLGKRLKRKSTLFASDVSAKALIVAKQNAKSHKVKIKFYDSNLFANIKGKFDVITANLPYVSKDDYKKFYENLKYEPRIALGEGRNTWPMYEKFFQQLPYHTNPGAVVLLEMDPKTKSYLLKWQKKYLPTWKINFYKDFNNLWRYAELRR
jgi:release factor glutamine methyltransferase